MFYAPYFHAADLKNEPLEEGSIELSFQRGWVEVVRGELKIRKRPGGRIIERHSLAENTQIYVENNDDLHIVKMPKKEKCEKKKNAGWHDDAER